MIRRQSIFIVGVLLIILGCSMFFSVACSLIYGDGDLIPLLQSIAVTISFGSFLALIFRNKEKKELSKELSGEYKELKKETLFSRNIRNSSAHGIQALTNKDIRGFQQLLAEFNESTA